MIVCDLCNSKIRKGLEQNLAEVCVKYGISELNHACSDCYREVAVIEQNARIKAADLSKREIHDGLVSLQKSKVPAFVPPPVSTPAVEEILNLKTQDPPLSKAEFNERSAVAGNSNATAPISAEELLEAQNS